MKFIFYKSFHKGFIDENYKTSGFSCKDVNNERIVCFEMKYGTLVTKNKNKIAFHCNSKNMCEAFRLVTMAIELAKTGAFRCDRSNIDREELLAIKHHKYEYDEIMNMLEAKEKELKEATVSSKLPEINDKAYIEKLLSDIRGDFYMNWMMQKMFPK